MHISGAIGHSLYWIIWEAVRRLEEINLKVSCQCTFFIKTSILRSTLFQVIAIVCQAKQEVFKSLGIEKHQKNGTTYKTVNRYSQDRFIYFMCDVPHLIKTTRNCWYSSTFNGTRCMWVCVLTFHTMNNYGLIRKTASTFCGIT